MIWGSRAFQGRRGASCRAWSRRALRATLLATAGLAAVGVGAGRTETVNGALAKAYLTNPEINTQRAAVRATDEGVPQANAGYLPKVSAFGDIAVSHQDGSQVIPGEGVIKYSTHAFPRAYGVQAQETVFDGYQTINRIRGAETQVMGAREQLRNTEQNTLLSGVTAYMNVLEDTAILELDNNNVQVLQEQLRETRDRFTVGEVTRTDVAQAEASLASGQAVAISAVATLQAAVASYRQVIGEQPGSLSPVKPIARPLPKTLPEAITISQVEHPAITALLDGVDAALLQIKVAEGALYPQASITATASNNYDVNITPGQKAFQAELMGQITIPIYQGGAEYASIRQSKETLTVQELKAEFGPRPDPPECRRRLGPQPSFGRGGARRARRGLRQRSCADRRPRRGQGGPTDDIGRAQRPAGAVAGSNDAGSGGARPGCQFLFAAVGDWPSQHPHPWSRGRRIRSAGPFRPGQEQVDRGEDA